MEWVDQYKYLGTDTVINKDGRITTQLQHGMYKENKNDSVHNNIYIYSYFNLRPRSAVLTKKETYKQQK